MDRNACDGEMNHGQTIELRLGAGLPDLHSRVYDRLDHPVQNPPNSERIKQNSALFRRGKKRAVHKNRVSSNSALYSVLFFKRLE